VLAFYSIVHFGYPDIERAVGERRRLLEPGGRILFSFHVGRRSATVKGLLGVKGANATRNFFDPERVTDIVGASGRALDEAVARFSYEGGEHPSQRGDVPATRKI
jgi:hypothetical protein